MWSVILLYSSHPRLRLGVMSTVHFRCIRRVWFKLTVGDATCRMLGSEFEIYRNSKGVDQSYLWWNEGRKTSSGNEAHVDV